LAASPMGHEAPQRYRALRIISTILRIFAYLVAVLGLIGVIVGAGFSGSQEGAGGAAAVLGIGIPYVLFITLFLLAYAELLRLLIDVEGNTRATADHLAGFYAPSPPAGAGPPPAR
jgi:hypothetical protein